MTNDYIRTHLINAGIVNLKEFGYPNVTTENILTDYIYRSMFESMLNENLGHDKQVDAVIKSLLIELSITEIK